MSDAEARHARRPSQSNDAARAPHKFGAIRLPEPYASQHEARIAAESERVLREEAEINRRIMIARGWIPPSEGGTDGKA
jgi:hypothetical protein